MLLLDRIYGGFGGKCNCDEKMVNIRWFIKFKLCGNIPFSSIKPKVYSEVTRFSTKVVRVSFFDSPLNSNGVNNFNYIYLKDGKKKNKRDKIQPSNKTTKICVP
jgi:hypothetical protein